ncbi:MAG: head decoration protein [Pseudomonadota bacterium]
MVAKVYKRILDGEHVITEANGSMSREQILLYRGAKIAPGTVLGMITASKLWKPLDLAAVDGSQTAAGILRDGRRELTTADTRRAVANVRDTDVNGKKLIWPAGITVNQRKAAEVQLAGTNVLVRY